MHATVAILTALASWNDLLLPLVMLSGGDNSVNTLPMAQMLFQSQFGTNYNLAFASYILSLLPMLIFYLFAQKHIINGVTNGAVKG
jgi:raffinose/stachyose/melibiose transport system permease protein